MSNKIIENGKFSKEICAKVGWGFIVPDPNGEIEFHALLKDLNDFIKYDEGNKYCAIQVNGLIKWLKEGKHSTKDYLPIAAKLDDLTLEGRIKIVLMLLATISAYQQSGTSNLDALDFLRESFTTTIGQVNRVHFEELKQNDEQKIKRDVPSPKYSIMRIDSMYYLMAGMMGLYEKFYQRYIHNDEFRRAMLTDGGFLVGDTFISTQAIAEFIGKLSEDVFNYDFGTPFLDAFKEFSENYRERENVFSALNMLQSKLSGSSADEDDSGHFKFFFDGFMKNFDFWPGVGMKIPANVRINLDFQNVFPSVVLRGATKKGKKVAQYFFSEQPWSVAFVTNELSTLWINGKRVGDKDSKELDYSDKLMDFIPIFNQTNENSTASRFSIPKGQYLKKISEINNIKLETFLRKAFSKEAFRDSSFITGYRSKLSLKLIDSWGVVKSMLEKKLTLEDKLISVDFEKIKEVLDNYNLKKYFPELERLWEQYRRVYREDFGKILIQIQDLVIYNVSIRIPLPPQRADLLLSVNYPRKIDDGEVEEAIVLTCC